MRKWIQAMDNILRGETTRLSRLREGPLEIPARGLTVLIIMLGAFHGSCMGWMALFNRDTPVYGQVLASMLKVPALFLLTLLVTFPSLYVFNALVGSRLTLVILFRLLIAALVVTLSVLASFGPIVAFFSLTTTNYPFMVLFNVLLFGLSLLDIPAPPVPAPLPAAVGGAEPSPTVVAAGEPSGALERLSGSVLGRNVKTVFFCWVFVFGLVGVQMSWILRPFIGNPDQPFEWFRARDSNFLEAVGRALLNLF
jgi:hypothetical protein